MNEITTSSSCRPTASPEAKKAAAAAAPSVLRLLDEEGAKKVLQEAASLVLVSRKRRIVCCRCDDDENDGEKEETSYGGESALANQVRRREALTATTTTSMPASSEEPSTKVHENRIRRRKRKRRLLVHETGVLTTTSSALLLLLLLGVLLLPPPGENGSTGGERRSLYFGVDASAEATSLVQIKMEQVQQRRRRRAVEDTTTTIKTNCKMFAMLPFTTTVKDDGVDGNSLKAEEEEHKFSLYDPWSNDKAVAVAKLGFDMLASTLLAIEHFNTRDPSVVPELSDLGNDCPVVLDEKPYVSDARPGDIDTAVWDAIVQAKASSMLGEDDRLVCTEKNDGVGSSNNSSNSSSSTSILVESGLCAVLGPSMDEPADAVSRVTSALGVPQLLFHPGASNKLLGFRTPTTVGVSMTVYGEARAIVEYLQQDKPTRKPRDYLVVVSSPPEDGMGARAVDLAHAVKEVGTKYKLSTVLLELKPDIDLMKTTTMVHSERQKDYFDVIKNIVESGIKTVMLNIIDTTKMVEFAYALDEYNETDMFGSDFVYLLSPEAFPPDRVSDVVGFQPEDSPVYKLLNGAIIWDSLDGFRYESSTLRNTTFIKAWQALDANFAARVWNLLPSDAREVLMDVLSPDYFQTSMPSNHVTFLYDAAMLVGFGKCYQELNDGFASPRSDDSGQASSQKPQPSETRYVQTGTNAGVSSSVPSESSECTKNPFTECSQDSDNERSIAESAGTRKLFLDGQRKPLIGAQDGDDGSRRRSRSLEEIAVPTWGGRAVPSLTSRRTAEAQSLLLNNLDPFVVSMTKVSFRGASGPIRFGAGFKFRDPESITVGMYNTRPRSSAEGRRLANASKNDGNDENKTFEVALIAVWRNSTANSTGWNKVAGVEFVYRDGTNNVPSQARDYEMNLLSGAVRGVGLGLMGLAWILCLGCIICIFVLRKDGLIKRSQPFFLHLLCCGAFVISVSIFTLSFDEGAGWSTSQLSAACTATPWFFFMGQLIAFSALFTRLWRLDKVLQFRRGNTVTVANVIAPLVVLLVVALVILIVWTVVDPWVWEREIIREAPAESYGQCVCDDWWAYFGPLMGLLILSEGITLYFALKTADVPEDFKDTNSVLYAIAAQLQAWVIGIPILSVLNTASASATYFSRVFLIWIFSVSSVGLVVAPKIFRAFYLRRNPHLLNKSKKSRVSVTGLVAPTTSSNRPSSTASHPTSGKSPDSGNIPTSQDRLSQLGQSFTTLPATDHQASFSYGLDNIGSTPPSFNSRASDPQVSYSSGLHNVEGGGGGSPQSSETKASDGAQDSLGNGSNNNVGSSNTTIQRTVIKPEMDDLQDSYASGLHDDDGSISTNHLFDEKKTNDSHQSSLESRQVVRSVAEEPPESEGSVASEELLEI